MCCPSSQGLRAIHKTKFPKCGLVLEEKKAVVPAFYAFQPEVFSSEGPSSIQECTLTPNAIAGSLRERMG